jgi:hypothetical protein
LDVLAMQPNMKKKYWIGLVVGVLGLIGIGVTAFAVALPSPAACLAIGLYEFEAISERFFVPPNSSPAQKAEYESLIREARERIKNTFGEPEADPIIVFFDDPRSFSPLFLNAFGQAPFVGKRACVIIGPRGQSVDVVSHELMHSEMHHRVGARGMFWETPVWFNEGVAMQVDYRDDYTLPAQETQHADYVRALATPSSFFVADDKALTRNYASAKTIVASWAMRTEPATLYSRLNALKRGAPFSEVFPEQELTLRSSEFCD